MTGDSAVAADSYLGDGGPPIPSPAIPVCGPDGWCFENPLPFDDNLAAIWRGPGNQLVVASTSGYMIRYDGSSWSALSPLPTPATATGAWTLKRVWGSGAHVFVIGSIGTSAVAWHFNGSVWNAAILQGNTSLGLADLHGVSPTEVYAGGGDALWLFDGSSWTPMQVPFTQASRIWAAGPKNVFVTGSTVGGSKVWHYDGSSWTTMPMPSTAATFDALHGSDPANVFAAGRTSSGATILWRFDGQAWSQLAAPMSATIIRDLFVGGPQTVFATGQVAGGSTAIWSYTGSSWIFDWLGGTPLLSLSGTSASDLFALAQRGVYRRGAVDWPLVFELPNAVSSAFRSIWGSGASDLFVVGEQGTIWHNDGSGWTPMTTPGAYNLTGVWGSGPSDVFAVGPSSTIWHYDGGNWSPMVAPQAIWDDLNAVWGSGPSDVYAGGNLGVLWHYNGSVWSEVTKPYTTDDFFSIWGSGPTDIFAVGERNLVFHYDGSVWAKMSPPSTYDDLFGVWGASNTDVHAVGEDSLVQHYDGAVWTNTLGPTTFAADLRAVHGTSASNIYAVATGGGIHHFNGSTWQEAGTGTNKTLYGIWVDPSTIRVIGANQTILSRTP